MNKTCTKCGVKYPATKEYFSPNKQHKDGLQSYCKKCHNIVSMDWRKKNPEYLKKYYQENKEKHCEYSRRYERKYRKTLKGYISNLVIAAKQRCNNPKNPFYKNYGGRGISCCFTPDELYDWLIAKNIDPRGRDIHRINNDGDYTLDNIVFLTRSEHTRLHKLKNRET